MKKTGKLALAFISPIACAMSIVPLVACSTSYTEEEEYIDPQIKYGDHVNKIVHTNISLNKEFTIEVRDFEEGYAEIDKDATKITIGGKDVSYSVEDSLIIKVPASVVTNNSISIKVETKATVSAFQAKWKKSDRHHWLPFGNQPILHPASSTKTAEKITADDFTIQVKYGNPETAEWVDLPLSDPNFKFRQFDNIVDAYVDATAEFKESGYTIQPTDLILPSGEVVPLHVKHFMFVYESKYLGQTQKCHVQANIFAYTESIAVDPDCLPLDNKIKTGERLKIYGNTTPSTAYSSNVNLEIVSQTAEATISGRNTLVAGDKPGTVKIRIQAYDDSEIYSEPVTITIEE